MKPKVLWRSRNLLFHLIRRDLLVSYKQTILGAFWTVLKPLAMAMVIVFVFKQIGDFPDYGQPYLLIAISALAFWEFFSSAVNRGSICLIDDRELITRANFPRILLLLNASLRNTVGLLINLVLVFIFMAYYGTPFTINLLWVPGIFVAVVLLNLSVGLWLGTINVFYRDIGTMVPFVIRLALFLSPVGFTLKSVPAAYQPVYSLNPLVAIIETMRFCVLGDSFFPGWQCIAIGALSLFILLVSGLFIFGKYERKFADII